MANISLFSRVLNGVQRQVDLSTNTLVVQAIQINGTLLSSSSTGADGSRLVGDFNDYTNFTPTAATVKGALLGIDSALSGSGSSQLDGSFRIENTSDNTKKIAFDASAITTATTRTIKMSDYNVDMSKLIWKDGSVAYTANQPMGGFKLTGLSAGSGAGDSVRYEQAILVSGANAFGANQSMGNNKLTNLADATSALDAVNLETLQNYVNGVSWKTHAQAIQTTALATNTYDNGSSGVGATLTATANGALVIDGYTVVTNDRVVIAGESAAANNGIYVVTQTGDSGTPYILTRSTDADLASQLPNAAIFIDNGTANANTAWVQTVVGAITIGTTSLSFSKFASVTPYNFRNGLAQTGQNVDVVPGDTSLTSTPGSLVVALNAAGAIVTSSGLMINLASSNPGLQISTNKLDVKYGSAIVASSSGVAWNPDGSSLEVSSNAARIKTTAYDQVTITGGGGSAAAVAQAPVVAWTEVAGQTFSANTTYAVRYGLEANSETSGRVYAADITTSSFDLFWVIGFIQTSGSSVSAGGSVTIISNGSLTLKSSDTDFGSTDPGKPIFLQSGGVNATTTAPSTSGQAVAMLGIVLSTTSFRALIRAPYVY